MQIESAKDLDVYKLAHKFAMEIFEITKSFPAEEEYALTSQIPALVEISVLKP